MKFGHKQFFLPFYVNVVMNICLYFMIRVILECLKITKNVLHFTFKCYNNSVCNFIFTSGVNEGKVR